MFNTNVFHSFFESSANSIRAVSAAFEPQQKVIGAINEVIESQQKAIQPLVDTFKLMFKKYAEVESDIEYIVTCALGPVYKDNDLIDSILKEQFPTIDCDKTPSDEKFRLIIGKLGHRGLLERAMEGFKKNDNPSKAIYEAAFIILNEKFGITRDKFDALTEKAILCGLEVATEIRT